jgi:Ca-activated chloride channel family protein
LTFLAVVGIQVSQGASAPGQSSDIQVQSNLVLIGTFVMDSRGSPVTDLDRSCFHLFEDGKEQVIRSWSSEDVSVSIGFVLDTSGSRASKLAMLKKAATHFVLTSNPNNEYLLIELQQRPRVVLAFTTNADRVLETIGRAQARGPTPLFDAVHLAVAEMRNARYPRRALLIVSDGSNNHSRYTERATKRLVSGIGLSTLHN